MCQGMQVTTIQAGNAEMRSWLKRNMSPENDASIDRLFKRLFSCE